MLPLRTAILAPLFCVTPERPICRDLFVIWARCKWDAKIRGFLIEKVGAMP